MTDLLPAGPTPATFALVLVGALSAGWIDAVVGGGGLLQLPALLLVPGLSPVQALATNKLASICGTTTSAVTYYRRAHPDLRTAVPMAAVALVSSVAGASIAAVLGGYLGSRTAATRGSGFIRIAFLVVVTALTVRVGSDVWTENLRPLLG